jgi:hypothetical protein
VKKVLQLCVDLYPRDRSTQKIGRFSASGIMAAVRALAIAVGLFSTAAFAQADAGVPAPGRPKAAVTGGVVKVPGPALKGLGNVKEEDEPLPPPPKADADVGLLRGVLFAFEPAPTEIRVLAIEDLGLLGDPRALNPLAQLVMDPNVTVQLAALRAIGAMQHPRAEAILANIVRHPSINERVKMSAIDALLFQNTASSIAFLQQLSRGSSFHPTLQQQARRVLLDLPGPTPPPPGNSL